MNNTRLVHYSFIWRCHFEFSNEFNIWIAGLLQSMAVIIQLPSIHETKKRLSELTKVLS